jgi:ATP-dependent protease ClpP protease subunit
LRFWWVFLPPCFTETLAKAAKPTHLLGRFALAFALVWCLFWLWRCQFLTFFCGCLANNQKRPQKTHFLRATLSGMTDQTKPTSQQPWYSIRKITPAASAASGVSASAEILIYGDIGPSWWEDESVTAASFIKDINALDAQAITVRINSVGGSVTDGIAIHNAMKRHKANITVVVDALAASIASLIAMAGDRVEMAENATMMIHAPWTGVAGNSTELRRVADMLDTWADAMSTSYAGKTGKPKQDMLALLTDGQDHWYTAEQAVEAGFADALVAASPMMASAKFDLSRFRNVPAALMAAAHAPESLPTAAPLVAEASPVAAATQPLENHMTEQVNTPAAALQPADSAAILAADKNRRTEIRAKFASFAQREGVQALQSQCEDDSTVTPDLAAARLLAHLGSQATPVAGHIVTVADETDKRRTAASAALMVRAGVADAKTREAVAAGNPFRGATLLDMAKSSLAQAGIKVDGMDKMQIVASAFTQGGSDFPVLLENAMHKTLQMAYATAPDTWSRFCARGSVSDFRAHNRYRVGSLGNLELVNELGEFTNKSIPDGEKSSIAAGTKGYIINLSRQAIVNDDLGAFMGLAASLGRAARRTVEADVYAALVSNSGNGPVLQDGKTLFHADHGNLVGTGVIPSVAAFEAMRVLMASQKDVGGNDFLDLRPAVLLAPIGLGGTARVINDAQYDPDTANKLQRPNMVRGLVSDVVDSPRLTGNGYYMFAAPTEAPVMEVAFLDGNDTPFLELENGFTVDGARWKVRLDYGVAGIDYRGAVKNPGASA